MASAAEPESNVHLGSGRYKLVPMLPIEMLGPKTKPMGFPGSPPQPRDTSYSNHACRLMLVSGRERAVGDGDAQADAGDGGDLREGVAAGVVVVRQPDSHDPSLEAEEPLVPRLVEPRRAHQRAEVERQDPAVARVADAVEACRDGRRRV